MFPASTFSCMSLTIGIKKSAADVDSLNIIGFSRTDATMISESLRISCCYLDCTSWSFDTIFT